MTPPRPPRQPVSLTGAEFDDIHEVLRRNYEPFTHADVLELIAGRRRVWKLLPAVAARPASAVEGDTVTVDDEDCGLIFEYVDRANTLDGYPSLDEEQAGLAAAWTAVRETACNLGRQVDP